LCVAQNSAQIAEIPGISRKGSLSFWKPRPPTLIPGRVQLPKAVKSRLRTSP
jgi:hypothetical protein